MTNDTNTPDIATMTPSERRAYFSSATEAISMPTAPIRRLPPRSRRHSVKHRAIR